MSHQNHVGAESWWQLDLIITVLCPITQNQLSPFVLFAVFTGSCLNCPFTEAPPSGLPWWINVHTRIWLIRHLFHWCLLCLESAVCLTCGEIKSWTLQNLKLESVVVAGDRQPHLCWSVLRCYRGWSPVHLKFIRFWTLHHFFGALTTHLTSVKLIRWRLLDGFLELIGRLQLLQRLKRLKAVLKTKIFLREGESWFCLKTQFIYHLVFSVRMKWTEILFHLGPTSLPLKQPQNDINCVDVPSVGDRVSSAALGGRTSPSSRNWDTVKH